MELTTQKSHDVVIERGKNKKCSFNVHVVVVLIRHQFRSFIHFPVFNALIYDINQALIVDISSSMMTIQLRGGGDTPRNPDAIVNMLCACV